VFAFYGKRKLLLYVLLALFVCANSARLTLIALEVPKILVVPNPFPQNLHIGACLILEIPSMFAAYWYVKVVDAPFEV